MSIAMLVTFSLVGQTRASESRKVYDIGMLSES